MPESVQLSAVDRVKGLIDEASASRAFAHYLRVRDRVFAMLDEWQSAGDLPSDYWRQELEGFDYMLDASPLIVRKLREHCYHLTGLRSYDYRGHHAGKGEPFAAKLRALRRMDASGLFVPESPLLGGFGHRIDGELVNLDTLKFYESLIAMDRGGILKSLKDGGAGRKVVVEIGGGWGGFAYQMKTLFPDVSYWIVDLPQSLLFSAVYLMTCFPEASVRFYGETPNKELRTAGRECDFVFVPHFAFRQATASPPDLGLNMISFQEMTDQQVDNYAGGLANLGCPVLYSHNRERSPHNAELSTVSGMLGKYFDLREYEVLGISYNELNFPAKSGRSSCQYVSGRSENDGAGSTLGLPNRQEKNASAYRHLVGHLKASTASQVWRKAIEPEYQGQTLPGVSASSCGCSAPKQSGVAEGWNPASRSPRVVLGMVLYNAAQHLPTAIESLLAQTYSDFRMVAVDDCSTDNTDAIMRHFASTDSRITYMRNETRVGMVRNKRKAFAAATSMGCEYFAWAADHDQWYPEWLERLVGALNTCSDVVLVYPITVPVDEKGQRVSVTVHTFQTCGLAMEQRVAKTAAGLVGAGNMIYGLFRADVVAACGNLPNCIMPDRLLLLKMSVHGAFKMLPEELWKRRYRTEELNGGKTYKGDVVKQRTSLFAQDCKPWWRHFPMLTHAFALSWYLSLHSASGTGSPGLGCLTALRYLRTNRRHLADDFCLLGESIHHKFGSHT